MKLALQFLGRAHQGKTAALSGNLLCQAMNKFNHRYADEMGICDIYSDLAILRCNLFNLSF